MRNLKRVLALALALVMVIGMMVMGASAASYTDADEITADYSVAIDVMSGVGMFEGNDGNFMPAKTLTQAEAAGLMARMMLGKKAADNLVASQQLFSDVPVDHWAAGEIEYCATMGLIDGDGTGKFNPDKELTGVAFAKLLLVAMGYDADAQGYVGANWAANISVDARKAGLMVDDVLLSAVVTREVAAQMLYQVLENDMVAYYTMFDKATGAPVLYDLHETGKTVMGTYFKNLRKVTGVIEAVASTGTTIGTTKVSATNVDWTDIGYAAYNWYLVGKKENVTTQTSITDVIITGESLGVSTSDLTNKQLTSMYNDNYTALNKYFMAALDSAYDVYYNGVKQTTAATITATLNKIGTIGVKVDYVDNDNQGKAEAIVVTEYTYDQVASVTKASYSGYVYDYWYHLVSEDASIYAGYLANVDGLSRGDHFTYVVYDGYYYVTVLEPEIMELDSITRKTLNNNKVYTYELDGEDYVASELDNKAIDMSNENLGDDMEIVLDEYGYIVYAAKDVDPDAYVYVVDNDDTKTLKGTTETSVIFADGTVAEIEVAEVTNHVAAEKAAAASEDHFEESELKGKIYSYTINKKGNYVLTDVADDTYTDDSYETNDLYFGTDEKKIKLTKTTTIVDARPKADTFGDVYTGYSELPDLSNAEIVYLTEEGATVKLGFLVDGDNSEDLKASFVVFDTTFNKVEKVGINEWTWTLEKGVLIKGKLVKNYVLTETQKEAIVENGVGAYDFGSDGNLKDNGFIPFTNKTIEWTPENSGTLIYGTKDVTDSWTPVFVNLEEGEIDYWFQFVVAGNYYCIVDDAVKTNVIVYIVTDYSVDDALSAAQAAALKAETDAIVAAGGVLTDDTVDISTAMGWSGYETVKKAVASLKAEIEACADLDALTTWQNNFGGAGKRGTKVGEAYAAAVATAAGEWVKWDAVFTDSYVEYNDALKLVYVGDSDLTVADYNSIAKAAKSTEISGWYFTQVNGLRTKVVVGTDNQTTIVDIMAQDGAVLTTGSGYTIVTSK